MGKAVAKGLKEKETYANLRAKNSQAKYNEQTEQEKCNRRQ